MANCIFQATTDHSNHHRNHSNFKSELCFFVDLEASCQIFEAFVRILLIVNLSLNQTLLTFLLCVRQTWMTQLILKISL